MYRYRPYHEALLFHFLLSIHTFCLRIPVVLALYTNRPWISTFHTIIDDERSEFPALDAAGIEAFAVIVELETTTGVMAINHCRALARGDEILVLVP